MNMCNLFIYKNVCFWNWLHFIWPYSSRTWESIRYANWGRGICETRSFTKFLILELVALHLALQFEYLGNCQVCELGKRNMCNQFVPKISDFRTGCTSSGPTVRVPGKLSGMRTGKEEYVQPVRSQNFSFWNWLHFIWPYLTINYTHSMINPCRHSCSFPYILLR